MLAQVVLSELAAPQQISLLQEAPLAAATTQTAAIRNQMMADNFGADTRAFANINYSNQQFDQSAGAPKTTSNNVDLTLGADVRASTTLFQRALHWASASTTPMSAAVAVTICKHLRAWVT